ncbi:hypothetical protein CNR22_12425 [Sphingobacteriaceae bacterium]|nr:hypothetical protein CNR22_12425 [Sphingobacteriaceae bacterium]
MEAGVSYYDFKRFPILNFRYISPRFRLVGESHEWSEEEEKHPEKFTRGRLMMEVFYRPVVPFLGASFNVQYRLLKYKKLHVEIYAGVKVIFLHERGYIVNPALKTENVKDSWYFNPGFIFQLDLGAVGPFADVSGDGIVTFGTELNIHLICKKIKKQFRAPYIKQG